MRVLVLLVCLFSLISTTVFAQAPNVGPVQCYENGRWTSCSSGSSGGGSSRTSGRTSSSSSPSLSPADKTFNQGNAMGRAGRWKEAEQLYRQALQLNPKHASAHYGLAIALANLGDIATAKSEAQAALKAGLSGQSKKDLEAWLSDLKREDTKKNNVAVSNQAFNEGVQFYGQGRYKEAEAAYRKAYAHDPDAPTASNLALTLAALGRAQEADEFYRKAIATDPKYALARSNYGAFLLNQHRPSDAEPQLRRALELGKQPNDEANLGLCLYRLGDGASTEVAKVRYEEAETLLRRSMAKSSTANIYREALGDVLRLKSARLGSAGDFAGAESASREATTWDPKNAKAHNNLATSLLRQGRQMDAAIEYQKVLKLDPNYTSAKEALAKIKEANPLTDLTLALEEAKGDAPAASAGAGSTGGATALQQAEAAKAAGKSAAVSGSAEEAGARARSVFDTLGFPPVPDTNVVNAGNIGSHQFSKSIQDKPQMIAIQRQREQLTSKHQELSRQLADINIRIADSEKRTGAADQADLLKKSSIKQDLSQNEYQTKVKEKEYVDLGLKFEEEENAGNKK
jgi:Flp pilus assembly protein TadD